MFNPRIAGTQVHKTYFGNPRIQSFHRSCDDEHPGWGAVRVTCPVTRQGELSSRKEPPTFGGGFLKSFVCRARDCPVTGRLRLADPATHSLLLRGWGSTSCRKRTVSPTPKFNQIRFIAPALNHGWNVISFFNLQLKNTISAVEIKPIQTCLCISTI